MSGSLATSSTWKPGGIENVLSGGFINGVTNSGTGVFSGGVLTLFFYQHNLVSYILGTWMLCYGLAICAVGLFSVPVVTPRIAIWFAPTPEV